MIEIKNKGKKYVEALRARYQADMLEAEAHLESYLKHVAAIGEHSDLTTEQDKWLEKYAAAKDKFESLEGLVKIKETEKKD